ncbi:MAG: hypothetical protein K2M94_02090 [Paramuribaculum sp.]|nr:hypothetical protein [Paramuribaculum sp.]
MDTSNKYDLISAAYRSRLLFRTDAEYREVLRVSFETVINKRDMVLDIEVYYGILNRITELTTDKSLDDVIGDYIAASRFYLSLDWGCRSQMASRKKFCRMLFRICATAGRNLSNEEFFKFRIKDDDDRLLKAFFPDGFGGAPAVDICLVVLFAFDVLRPFTDTSRSRDIRDSETIASLLRLRLLMALLKDDSPRLGSMDKPLAFDEWLGSIDNHLSDPDSLSECTPLWLISSLTSTMHACQSLVIVGRQRVESERFQGLYMSGIWIDDADRGQNRFWIFPDNLLGAFCYRRDGMVWQLSPYDFRVCSAQRPDYMDNFILLTPRGNLGYTLSSERVIEPEQIVTGSYEQEFDETTGSIKRLVLYEEPRQFPQWMDWRKWECLSPDDPRYKEYRGVLTDIYDLRSPYSAVFRNSYAELTDIANKLVGHDRKYLYVYDCDHGRYMIKEAVSGRFTYEAESGDDVCMNALFELDITAEHPLYALPVGMARSKYGDTELDKLADILADAENIKEVYIIHSRRSPYPRLVFPAYGVSIGLDMNRLTQAGVMKFTSRQF